MEYRVVQATLLSDLVKEVNEWTAEGWRPVGGPTLVERSGTSFYIQALTYTVA